MIKKNKVVVLKDQPYFQNSNTFNIKPDQQYKVSTQVTSSKGSAFSGYFGIIILNNNGEELSRRIRWFTNFSGTPSDYTIIFTSEKVAQQIVFVYRINHETPFQEEFEAELQDLSTIQLEEVSNLQDTFDNVNDFTVPDLEPLNPQEEDILEQKLVWLFSPPRSGTTWLGSQLLKHNDNIIWFEPWIGLHLGMLDNDQNLKFDEPKFLRVIDTQAQNPSYFFSPHHKNNWKPALRKFILSRAYSEAQTLEKNIIVKEPVGSLSAEIIMECLPNSKIIFLIRDGRDVVDSRMDMHGKETWAKLSVLDTPQKRKKILRWYSFQWVKINEKINQAYQNHNPQNRILVKYEDLKRDTFSELKKIYDFLKITISDEELKKIIEKHEFKKIPSEKKGVGKFYRAASTGGWKNNLNSEEQALMNSIMKKTLDELNYAE